MPLKNLPVGNAVALADLMTQRPGQVSSMALSCSDDVDMTLLAFSGGESVSEEEYLGDTMYFAVQGDAVVVLPDRREPVRQGEVLMVPQHVEHAVQGAGDGAFKLLQISLK